MNLIEKWKNRETKKKLHDENIRLKAQLEVQWRTKYPVVTIGRNIHAVKGAFHTTRYGEMDIPPECREEIAKELIKHDLCGILNRLLSMTLNPMVTVEWITLEPCMLSREIGKMIEKIKDIREVTQVKETVIGEIMKCDICGKVIYDTQKEEPTDMRKGQHWWHLTTGHNDWGHDSVDSIESFDICSRECLSKKFEEYLEVSDHMLGSQYFELEQETR